MTTVTIRRWRREHQGVCNALRAGKAEADTRVEHALYHRAVGYSYDAVTVMQNAGVPMIVPYREHIPPDVVACTLWLKNRQSDKWRRDA